MRLFAVGCVVLAACAVDPEPEVDPVALAGPFQIGKHERSTRGAASLQDIEGSLSDSDLLVAPDAAPFWAEASAGVMRGNVTAAGVTTHDSELGGRTLRLDGHCDANANVADTETEYGNASCGNAYEVQFTLARPAKVSFSGEIQTAVAGFGGGWGVIALRDATGTVIAGLEGDYGELYESLSLPIGSYELTATGNASAIAFDIHQFSAVTFDLRFRLQSRTY